MTNAALRNVMRSALRRFETRADEIAKRYAPILAAESDAAKVRAILVDVIEELRRLLRDEIVAALRAEGLAVDAATLRKFDRELGVRRLRVVQ